MIGFNQITADLRVPGQYIEFSNENMNQGLSGYPTKLLVVGQKLAAGTAPVLVPQLITRTEQAKALFGRGSQLAHMCEVSRGFTENLELWAIAVDDDNAAAAATGSITLAGTATAAGTLVLYVGGRYQVKTRVTVGMTAAQLATALVASLGENLDLPITAVVDGEITTKVNITARNAGEAANTIPLVFNYYTGEVTPAGITTTVVQLSGGTGNPEIDDVFAAIGDAWYTDMVTPWLDGANMAALETELATRSGALKQIETFAYLTRSATLANLVLAAQGRNSEYVAPLGVKGNLEPVYEWASVLATMVAHNSKIDPARPVQHIVMTGLKAPAVKDRFTMEERNILLHNGHGTYYVDDGGNVRIERVITSYRKNALGFDDPSYLNIETMKTMAYLRYDVRSMIAQRFPDYKLAKDGTNFARGDKVVTPEIIRNALIARFQLWEQAGLVEDIEQFKRDLIVEIDANDPDRVNVYIPPNVINQFRIFAGKLAPIR